MIKKIEMRILFVTLISLLIFACSGTQMKQAANFEEITFQPKDKEIIEQLFELFSNDTNTPIPVLMVKVGTFFKETPYVAHTLETDKEQLVINLREMDCTTFAENCLAISKTIKSKEPTFEQFTQELIKIRYREGKIDGYPSRLHYFSDWIYDNDRKKIIESASKEIAQIPYKNVVNFMSTHPDSYQQLKENSELVQILAEQENQISAREAYYIPENKISEFEDKLMDGDIVGITTGIKGLDISHVGILVRKAGRIHIMHASSKAEKVIVSEETLGEYLLSSKSATGIMVARPV
jgi:hypothetical protein